MQSGRPISKGSLIQKSSSIYKLPDAEITGSKLQTSTEMHRSTRNRRNKWFMFLVSNQWGKKVFLVSLFPKQNFERVFLVSLFPKQRLKNIVSCFPVSETRFGKRVSCFSVSKQGLKNTVSCFFVSESTNQMFLFPPKIRNNV